MAVGHTKFAPDRGFGHIRCKEKNSHCYDGDELLHMISQSASSNVGVEMDNSFFCKWKEWKNERYNKLSGIKKKPIVQIVISRFENDNSEVEMVEGLYKVKVTLKTIKAMPDNDLKCECEETTENKVQKRQSYSASRSLESLPSLPRRDLSAARKAQLQSQIEKSIPMSNKKFWDDLLKESDSEAPVESVVAVPAATAMESATDCPLTPDFENMISPPSSPTTLPSTPIREVDESFLRTPSQDRSGVPVILSNLQVTTGVRRLDKELAELPSKRRRVAKKLE